MKEFLKNKRGSIVLYLSFIIVAVIVIITTAVVAPMGTMISTEFYAAGEDILLKANESVANINNATIRNEIYNTIGDAQATTQDNITITSSLFQYGWILVVVIAALVAFLFSRRLVELGQGGVI